VFATLNPGKPYVGVRKEVLESEAVISKHMRVTTPHGPVPICQIRPGDYVIDANGDATRVTGIVRVDGSEVLEAMRIHDNYVSASVWMKGVTWNQPQPTERITSTDVWHSLFTESGSYNLYDVPCHGIRDFTDIGPEHIHETYNWVLTYLTH
jgi:hypothetical protein